LKRRHGDRQCARSTHRGAHASDVALTVLGRPGLRREVDRPRLVRDVQLLEQPCDAAAARRHRVVQQDCGRRVGSCHRSHGLDDRTTPAWRRSHTATAIFSGRAAAVWLQSSMCSKMHRVRCHKRRAQQQEMAASTQFGTPDRTHALRLSLGGRIDVGFNVPTVRCESCQTKRLPIP